MVDIPIILDTIYNKKGVQQLRRGLGGVEKEMNKISALQATIAGAGVVAAIGVTAKTTADLVLLSDEAAKTEQTFINLSGSQAEATANMEAMDAATKGLTSDMDAQAIASQLLGMQIVDNADELEKVVSVSRRLGKEFRGLGTEEAANEFAIMVSNMSVQRLDSFGISSGRVRKRIDELLDSTEGLTREQAFFQVTMEEAEATLDRLGPEYETTSDRVDDLTSSIDDLKVATGDLFSQFADSQGLELLTDATDGLTDFIDAMNDYIDTSQKVEDRTRETNGELGETADDIDKLGIIAGIATGPVGWLGLAVDGLGKVLVNNTAEYMGWIEAVEDGTEALEDQKEAFDDLGNVTDATSEMLDAIKEANEEIAKAAAERLETERDALRDIIDIEQDANDERLDNAEDLRDSVKKLRADEKKDARKDARDLGRDIEKVDKNAAKSIEKQREKFRTEERNDKLTAQADATADQATFDLSLQHMAEDADSIGIRRALERREVEEANKKEQARVEQQIEAASQKEEIDTIKETSAARKEELRDSAALEQQLRQEDLSQRIVDESEYFTERNALIEEGADAAIATVGRELVTINELTTANLMNLAQQAGQLGFGVGANFASGITEGYRSEAQISSAQQGGITANINQNISGVDAGPLAAFLEQNTKSLIRQYNDAQVRQANS